MLISVETYRTCDFPGGVRTPYPPSGTVYGPDLDPICLTLMNGFPSKLFFEKVDLKKKIADDNIF